MKVIVIVSVTDSEKIRVVGPFHSDSQIASYFDKHGFTKRLANDPHGHYLNASITERATVEPLEAP